MFLPPELYRPIIQYVDARADLHRLLFVSRLVSYEAERTLYHTIHITATPPSLIGLFLHLTRIQRVAHHVRELRIPDAIALESLTMVGTEIPSSAQYWNSLNQALCTLTNLRVLTLAMYLKGPRVNRPPSDIFSNCIFKLEVLMLTGHLPVSLSLLDLTQVKELRLTAWRNSITLFSSDAFRSLQTLSSSSSQFLQLGIDNTRQIKSMELAIYPSVIFNAKFTNITSLKLFRRCDSYIQAFPSLRYLSVAMRTGVIVTDPDISILVNVLSSLGSLEKLCLRGGRHPDGLCARLFSTISSLQELDIVNLPYDAERWSRNAKYPVGILEVFNENEWQDTRWH